MKVTGLYFKCFVGRNLFGEIDIHLFGKSGRVVPDLEVREA